MLSLRSISHGSDIKNGGKRSAARRSLKSLRTTTSLEIRRLSTRVGTFSPHSTYYSSGGRHARIWAFPVSVLWMWICPLLPAHDSCCIAREARQDFYLSAQLLFGMER